MDIDTKSPFGSDSTVDKSGLFSICGFIEKGNLWVYIRVVA